MEEGPEVIPEAELRVPPVVIGIILLLTVVLAVTFLVAAHVVQTP